MFFCLIHFERVETKWFLSHNFFMFPFSATYSLARAFFLLLRFLGCPAIFNKRYQCRNTLTSNPNPVSQTCHTHKLVLPWVNAKVRPKCNSTIIFWIVHLLRIILCTKETTCAHHFANEPRSKAIPFSF